MTGLYSFLRRCVFADSRLAPFRRLAGDAVLRQMAKDYTICSLGPAPDSECLRLREVVRQECRRRGNERLFRVAGLSALRAVFEQVRRVARSEHFATSPLLQKILLVVVRHGVRGERLKEISIAAALERSGYDPATGGLRSELQRLRSRLDDYFAGAGGEDPILIEIPKGGYAPRFFQPTRMVEPLSIVLRKLYALGERTGRDRFSHAAGLCLVFTVWWLWMMSSVEYRVHWRTQANDSFAAFQARVEVAARTGPSPAICAQPLNPSLEQALSRVAPPGRLPDVRCGWLEWAGTAAGSGGRSYLRGLLLYLFFDPTLVVDKGLLWPLLLTLIFNATVVATLLAERPCRGRRMLAGLPASAQPAIRWLWGSERLVLLSAYASGVLTVAHTLSKANSVDVNIFLAVGFGLAGAVFTLVFLQHIWRLIRPDETAERPIEQKDVFAVTFGGLSIAALAVGLGVGLGSAEIVGFPDTEGGLQPFVALLSFVAHYYAIYGLTLLFLSAAAAAAPSSRAVHGVGRRTLARSWTTGVWCWATVGAIVLTEMERSQGLSEGQLWFHAAAAAPGTVGLVLWLIFAKRMTIHSPPRSPRAG